jgi:Flp pilus assembly protein TadD
MPLVPVLLLYAAAGLLRLGGAVRKKMWSALPIGVCLFVLVFLLNHDFGVIGPLDWTLGYLGEGVSYLERGDPAAAAARFREALRLTPGSSEGEHDLGVALREMGDLEGAIASFRRSLSLDSRNPEAYNNLALALSSAGRSGEAESAYREGIALDPRNPGLRVNLAQLLQREARYAEAAEEYRVFLRSGGEDGRVHANLGLCLAQSGRPEEGEREMKLGVELAPSIAGPTLLLAEHWAASGRIDEARDLLAGAAARLPGETALAEALRALDSRAGP